MRTFVVKMLAVAIAATLFIASGNDGQAQDSSEPAAVDRSATGGAQTLEDIMRRQRGESVPADTGNGNAASGDGDSSGPLGAQGALSDSELWRQARQGQAFSSSLQDPNAGILVQDEGTAWLKNRQTTLPKYTTYALLAILILLTLFMLIRGRIRIMAGWSSIKIQRFTFIERFGHWLLATSFIILAITGLALLFGREYLIPAIDWAHAKMNPDAIDPNYGRDAYASFALVGKWLHDNIAWAFMLGLVLIFVMWVFRNIPTWTDVKWLAKGGGMFSNASHPHARKFNAGQKILFWLVIILGGSLSASGISLLQPNEYAMFGATFEKLNMASEAIGYPLGLETNLSSLQEMQYSQMWHTIIGVALTVIVIAHIYIGSVGMQGAFSAMGSGKVDLNWAREHHDLWVSKLEKKGKIPRPAGASRPSTRTMPLRAPKKPTPAE